MTIEQLKSNIDRSFGAFWLKYFYDKHIVKKKGDTDKFIADILDYDVDAAKNRLSRHNIQTIDTYEYRPIIIYKNKRNKADGAIPVISKDTDIVIGGQPGGSKYGKDKVLKIGEAAVPAGYVIYQTNFTKLLSAEAIINNIFLPVSEQVIYNKNDFYIENYLILIKEELDPFNNKDKFLILGKDENEYCIMWLKTASIESNAVLEALPRPKELLNSDELYYLKTATNAFYDSAYKPVNKEYLTKAIETILGYSPVKIYIVDSFDTIRAYNNKSISDFMLDVPYIILSDTVFSKDVADFTVIFKNADTDLIYAGIDANGNRKYKFKFDVTSEQQDYFWSGVWRRYENENRNMTDDFSDYITHYPNVENSVCGKINPVKFFIEKLNRGNNLICILEFNKIPDYIISIDVVSLISKLLPANILFIAIGVMGQLDDTWNMSAGDNIIVDTYDELNEEIIISMGDSIQCRVI